MIQNAEGIGKPLSKIYLNILRSEVKSQYIKLSLLYQLSSAKKFVVLVRRISMELRKYLPGGLAPGIILNDHLEMLKNQLVKTDEADKLLELLLVGLISYTETFYKSFFAASINMFPVLANKLKGTNTKKGFEMPILVDDLFFYGLDMRDCLGYLIADKLPFDKAVDINRNFSALIKLTPFSEDEKEKYQEIKDQRNLYVHNSGIMNKRFVENKPFFYQSRLNQTFYAMSKWQLEEAISFIVQTSKRFLGLAKGKIEQEINSYRYKRDGWEDMLERLIRWEPPLS